MPLSMPRWLPVLGVGVAWLVTVVYFVAIRQAGTPAVSAGRWSFTVGEIAGGITITQTLLVGANGLRRITIEPRPVGPDTRGEVLIALRDMTEDPRGRIWYWIAVPARRVVAGASYDFELPPIPDSRGRRYRLDISVPNAKPGQGITLRATAGHRYTEGKLFFDSREIPADLVFRTDATEASAWARMVARFRSGRDRQPTGTVLLLALAMALIGLACVCWVLASDLRARQAG